MQSNGDTPHPGTPDPNDAPTDRLPAGESVEDAAPDVAQQPGAAAGAPLNQGDLSDEPTQPLPPVPEEGAAPPAGDDVFAAHVPVAGATAAGGGASMGAGLPPEGGGPGGPTEPTGGRRSVLPWILGAVAVLLAAGIAALFAFGFQQDEAPATSPTETPKPSVSVPSVTFGPIEPSQPPGEPAPEPEPTQAPPPPPAPDEDPTPTQPEPSTPPAPEPTTPPSEPSPTTPAP